MPYTCIKKVVKTYRTYSQSELSVQNVDGEARAGGKIDVGGRVKEVADYR